MVLRLLICVIFWALPALAMAAEATAPASSVAVKPDKVSLANPPVNPTAGSEAATPAEEDDNPQTSNTAVLQGLNKVTGHISRLEGPIGATMHFGNLEIIPHRCWKSAPEDRPENAVLLEIHELHTGEEPKRIFLGWMFSSSPGLSGLENPVYDITVLDCEFRPPPEKNAAPAAVSSPAHVMKAKSARKKTEKHKKKVVKPNN